jgi:hypothetical protein
MIKHPVDGSVQDKKTRSITRGFSQTEGVFYDQTIDVVKVIHFHLYYHP